MYRIDILLKENRPLFHTRDLALLWGIENENTLYTTVKRYIRSGVLIPIHKGFYSTLPLYRINPILLGVTAVDAFSYLSCEYILSLAGVIFQVSDYITLVSSLSTRFTIYKHNFLVRKMADIYLFNDAGIDDKDGIKIATPERAAADMLYYNPYCHFDNTKGLDWLKIRKIRQEVFSL